MRPAGFALMGGILVIGSYNRDTALRLARFPAPGETLTALGMAEFHGGKGSNQSVAAARAGGRVALIAAIGDDASGHAARALWAAEGIDAQSVQTARAPTGAATILLDSAGENHHGQLIPITSINVNVNVKSATCLSRQLISIFSTFTRNFQCV
jgi:hypothetical protein